MNNDAETKTAGDRNVYMIPSWRMDYLAKRLADLSRRARKLGCAEPVTIGHGVYDEPEMKWKVEIGSKPKQVPTGRINRFYFVEMVGAAPSYAGWTFVASIDKMPEVGNLVRVVPGQALPERYRTEEPHCDQCKANRARINHYVVRSEAGEFRMVGSSCIKDFLGHTSPDNIALLATFSASLDGAMSEAADGGGSAGPDYLDLARFLSYVAASVTQDGWLSAGRAREEGRSATKDRALTGMFHTRKECRTGCLHPTEADQDLAARALAWAAEIEVKSDFDHNLHTLAQAEVLPYKGAGIAAAMIFCYKRSVEQTILRENRAKQFANSVHVGEIGKRQDFTVTVANEHEIAGDYGTTSIYKMIDDKGNCLTWFSSSRTLELGKAYVLKGTVKAHDDYKGTKQTVITRCKIVREIVSEPAPEAA
jgi:hypothetical protein